MNHSFFFEKRFYRSTSKTIGSFFLLTTTCALLIPFLGFSQNKNNSKDSQKDVTSQDLLEQFAQSKGNNVISFAASNIKQFWVDDSVLSKNNAIEISLTNKGAKTYKSVSLPIQLANVKETLDCKIDVITSDKDMSFFVTNKKEKVLSTSTPGDDFIQYHTFTSLFHLEDTESFSFNMVFASSDSKIVIQKIVLSFQPNPKSAFLGSPGFKTLLKEINDNGTSIPNKDIRYIISKEYNSIYIRIPKDNASIPYFLYHVYPKDKKDLLPDRVAHGFNNNDFNLRNKKCIVPEDVPFNSEYFIVKCDLPSYAYSVIEIGQFDNSKRYWTIVLKDAPAQKE